MKLNDFQYDVGGAPVIFSTGHNRPENPLHRPEVHYRKAVLSAAGLVALVIAVILFCSVWNSLFETKLETERKLLICVAAAGLYILLLSKKAVIWLVHLYQNKASDETRLRCVFEPSCSEYMILAVEKYGTIIGVVKGFRRLMRCHAPNGGKDYP